MEDDKIIPYETSPSLTVKQAVMYMLGFRGEYYFVAEGEQMEFDLSDYLYYEQERPDADYNNDCVALKRLQQNGSASPEAIKIAEEKVATSKAKLEKANKLPIIAEQYRLLIDNEIKRAKLGKRDTLIIDEEESACAGQPRINKASFQEWLEGMELDDDNEVSVPKRLPLVDVALEHAIDKASKPIESLYLTLGLLISLFAESSGGEFGTCQKPTVNNIAKAIAKYANERNGGKRLRGQGPERIKDRIEVALSVLDTTI